MPAPPTTAVGAGLLGLGLRLAACGSAANSAAPAASTGVPMVQQLNDLGQLVGRDFTLVVLPLPMRGGTASPVRPVALLH
jgi:hypothetical protein